MVLLELSILAKAAKVDKTERERERERESLTSGGSRRSGPASHTGP